MRAEPEGPRGPGGTRGTRDPAARLLQLLSLLQAPRDWTGAELAERLEVTPRTGARVPARELPDRQDAAAYVADAPAAGPGTCRAELIIHAPIERAAEGMPASLGVLERLDEDRCRLRTAVDSPEYLALRIATLHLDYTLLGPSGIVPHLRRIAERALGAIQSAPGPDS
nr:WYL domain-containing protein [Streptomyces sp. NBRC 110611]